MHDGQAVPPDGARAVARNGRDWYEALARSRYRVTSDLQGVHDLSSQRRQTVLQTWHGVPVTSVGLDDEHAGTRLGRGWEERLRAESARWDVVLSAGPHGRELLQRAFGLGDAVRETGLPRHDLLVSPDLAAEREKRAAAVRDELGIPAGRRIVLLAPTYRPGLQVAPDRYRLDLFLDPAQLADVARRRPRAAGPRPPQGRRHRPAGRRPHGVRRVLARGRSRPAARRRRAGDRLLVACSSTSR